MSSLKRIVLGAVLLALPVAAQAQTSRVEGMALPGDYIKDYTGIYTYVSGVSSVGNLVYGELGNLLTNPSTGNPVTLDRAVGAVLGNLWDGRLGTWAVHLREQTPALGQGDAFSQPNPGLLGGDPNTHTNESFDLMWGYKFGTTSLGLRLNRSYFAFEEALPGVTTNLKFDVPSTGVGGDPNLHRNILGMGGGVGFEMNPNTNVELSLLWQNRDFESSVTGGTRDEADNTTSWLVAGRAMWQWQPNVMLVPVVKFYNFDLSTKSTPAGGASVSTDNSLSGWQVGAAGNWTIGTNDLFVLGVAFAQNRIDQQYDVFGIAGATGLDPELEATETMMPNVFAALETHVNPWLTLRFGASKGAFETLDIEDADESVEISQSSFNMAIGAGVKLGTLQLDAVLDDLFPQTLGGWFSNAPGGLVSFPKVTATYAF